jgi:hypothetical protein
MKLDSDGAYLMCQGDVFDRNTDPNWSGPSFLCEQEGTGNYVFISSEFAEGDPTRLKARQGSTMRRFHVNWPNAGIELYTEEHIEAEKREAYTIDAFGKMVNSGPWWKVI